MKSKALSLVIASILTIALLTANTSAVYATEDEIEELQEDVNEIKDTVEGLQFTLQEGVNELIAICPTLQQPQEPQQPTEEEQNETQGCQPIQEEPETILPPVEAEEPQEQNNTETGCNPIPEQNQSVLEPIICPIDGSLLGYLNTTSGEQLPISAGEQNQTQQESFLPPTVEVPSQEEQEQIAPTIEDPEQCNNVTQTQEQPQEQQEEAVEFNEGCGCFEQSKPQLEGQSLQ